MDNPQLLAPAFSEEGLLLCPVCQDPNVHLQAVEVNAGGLVSKIEYQAPHIRRGPPWGRGTLIRVLQWAECGHSWTRQIYFHKGQTWEEIFETRQGLNNMTDMWRE